MSNSLPTPHPNACVRSVISAFARILSRVALMTLRILPRKGRMAWVSRLRPCLAEPPAESPSTMKSSVSSASRFEQSASLPGRRNFDVAVLRARERSSLRRRRSSVRRIISSRRALLLAGSFESHRSK